MGSLWQDPRILRLVPWAVCVAALALGVIGCSGKPKARQPLSAPSWRAELAVQGFGAATVALPLGTREARPIVAVLHGAADHPDWQCGSFRGVFGGRAFIVCPRGVARPDGRFGLGTVDDTAAELRAALQALKTRYDGYVAPSPIVLVGYGEGAEHAAELARQEPTFFARVVLVDGNPAAFTSSASTIFGRKGGKRVLFFCSTADCHGNGAMRALLLNRAGAAAKAVKHDVGPFLDQRFSDALKGELPWLLEGDVRWGKTSR